MTINTMYGEWLKEIRKRTGLTQFQFSRFYGIPYRTLQNWENGKRELKEYVFYILKRCIDEDEESICRDLPEDFTLKDGWMNAYRFKMNIEHDVMI